MSGKAPDSAPQGNLSRMPSDRSNSVWDWLPWRLLARLRDLERSSFEREQRLVEREQRLVERLDQCESRLDLFGPVERRLDALESGAAGGAERLDQLEGAVRQLQTLIEELKARNLGGMEERQDQLETGLGQLGGELVRIRDGVLPASEGRWNALFERLFFEVEEIASMLERVVASDPLPVPALSAEEEELTESLTKVQKELVESFRGSEEEITHRLAANLPFLEGRTPLLDLGCGRGEWLGLLMERGISAEGIESDPALVNSARRRGLNVRNGDVLEEIRKSDDSSFGLITAFHLLEHLPPGQVLLLLEQVRRVLKPGGRVLIECPNPANLRVGGSLFWLDPTHRKPLHRETLELYCRSCGFHVVDSVERHPFPPDQHFFEAGAEPMDRLGRMEARLDELLNGPRDYFLLLETGVQE